MVGQRAVTPWLRQVGSIPTQLTSNYGVYSVVVCIGCCERLGMSSILIRHPKIMNMFKVYWTDIGGESCHENFDDMTEALNWMQELRNTYKRKFVCMASENPDNVTKLGVSEVNADYDWKKRRT